MPLLPQRPPTNATTGGWTALMWATNSAHVPLASFLLSRGADVAARSHRGTSCEDFVLSISSASASDDEEAEDGAEWRWRTCNGAGDGGGVRAANGFGFGEAHGPGHGSAQDRELIADMIIEHQKALAATAAAAATVANASSDPASGIRATGFNGQQGWAGTGAAPTHSHTHSRPNSPTKPSPLASSSSSNDHSPPPPPTHNRTSSLASTTTTPRRLLDRAERLALSELALRAREASEARKRALLEIATTLELDFEHLLGDPPPSEGAGVESDRARRRRLREERELERERDQRSRQRAESGATDSSGPGPFSASSSTSASTARSSGPRAPLHAHLASAGKRLLRTGLASGCGALEVGADALSDEFDFARVTPDQMLVLGEHDVAPLLDLLIRGRGVRPLRAPWTARATPANTLFLCARYAARSANAELLEDLLVGAIDAIEESIYVSVPMGLVLGDRRLRSHRLTRSSSSSHPRISQAHAQDMSWLCYWLFNTTLLLHYFSADALLSASPLAREYPALLVDLLNEIYVFLIRDCERRVDRLLDAALLDHDSLPFASGSEILFEGDWNFMKTLAGSVRGRASTNVHSTASGQSTPQRRPLSQIFGGGGSNSNTNSPLALSSSPSATAGRGGLAPGSSSPSKRPLSELLPDTSDPLPANASAAEILAHPSPRAITLILTSALQVMQLYEINPAIIVQVLSQVVFWVGCEAFNRVLANKRYLCRSKAMQIRLNLSALEDWARSNALPLAIVTKHLAPLNQLLTWLQCQSTLNDFDSLIVTLQGLKALNPLQLRRAVRDYRYEVNEARMSEECAQYLLQAHEDWERSVQAHQISEMERSKSTDREGHGRDATITQDGVKGEASGDVTMQKTREPESREEAEGKVKAQLAIDALFEPGSSIADYDPPWTALGPSGDLVALARNVRATDNSRGEQLNSREMLPFALPSGSGMLTVSPGDSLNFGRGHFNGTGAPFLRSLHNSTLSSPANSGTQTPKGLLFDDDSVSVASSRHTHSSSASRQSLFSTGHGFGAGGSWKPVPLLPEGLLDKIDDLFRQQRPAVEHRLHTLSMLRSPEMPSPTIPRLEPQPKTLATSRARARPHSHRTTPAAMQKSRGSISEAHRPSLRCLLDSPSRTAECTQRTDPTWTRPLAGCQSACTNTDVAMLHVCAVSTACPVGAFRRSYDPRDSRRVRLSRLAPCTTRGSS